MRLLDQQPEQSPTDRKVSDDLNEILADSYGDEFLETTSVADDAEGAVPGANQITR